MTTAINDGKWKQLKVLFFFFFFHNRIQYDNYAILWIYVMCYVMYDCWFVCFPFASNFIVLVVFVSLFNSSHDSIQCKQFKFFGKLYSERSRMNTRFSLISPNPVFCFQSPTGSWVNTKKKIWNVNTTKAYDNSIRAIIRSWQTTINNEPYNFLNILLLLPLNDRIELNLKLKDNVQRATGNGCSMFDVWYT